MDFKLVDGCRIPQEKAAVYGEYIAELSEKYGSVTPKMIVELAAKPSCPLHSYFEWDDEKAAEEYRLEQARLLLRSIIIVDETVDGGEVRAFYNVSEPHLEGKTYVSLKRVLSEPELREQVIQYAYAELVGWRERYKRYSEFRNIFKDISALGKSLKHKKKRR